MFFIMSKIWDDTLKRLFAVNPQDVVAWLMPGALLLADAPLELKYSTKTRHADALYKVLIDGQDALIHIEFQKRADPRMAERVWEYNVLATLAHRCPVYSFVIYLRRTSAVPESPLEWGLSCYERVHLFRFQNIKLWELAANDVKRSGLKGVLPLCLLTQDGAVYTVAEDVFAELKDQKELLTLALTLASMIFVNSVDQQWFERQVLMLEDIVTETWFYKWILQKGMTEGRQEGRQEALQEALQKELQRDRQVLVSAVEGRFPALASLARQRADALDDPDALQHLLLKMIVARDADEARALLEATEEQ
jgi:predicted transposase YdaD